MSLGDIIRREMAGLFDVTPDLAARLEAHYELMVHWNQTLNLTTVTDEAEAAVRHYCESLYLARVLTPGRVADVGSGPGFPGLIAAAARPDCQFDLIESHQRKAVFLKEASRGMGNVRVVAKRAEVIRERYDWVVSRAVRPADVVRLNLAPRVALLIGEEDAFALPGFSIDRLPWGSERVLSIRVPRETIE
ncbi:MAG TPA: 16S rRNA (guanine(527)-N(7))-methyltransferase RsmG [Bryobacteraceae bacterium]|jgi:16S rRNA (guanine527-N7)-methyltransferase